MTKPRVLIVEDEEKLRRSLSKGLAEQGYDVVAIADGAEGLIRATNDTFDCLILDLMLPGKTGLEILRHVRATDITTPVLMLTARGEIDDRVQGLDSGADDYLAKPFAWAELLARLRACLRRRDGDSLTRLRIRNLTFDCLHRRLLNGQTEVELSSRESELLEYLVCRKGQVVSREELSTNVWREPLGELTNVVEVYIKYLRKKLERAGEVGLIQTVRGIGYCLQE